MQRRQYCISPLLVQRVRSTGSWLARTFLKVVMWIDCIVNQMCGGRGCRRYCQKTWMIPGISGWCICIWTWWSWWCCRHLRFHCLGRWWWRVLLNDWIQGFRFHATKAILRNDGLPRMSTWRIPPHTRMMIYRHRKWWGRLFTVDVYKTLGISVYNLVRLCNVCKKLCAVLRNNKGGHCCEEMAAYEILT